MELFDYHIWLSFHTWMSLLTLTLLEIVLGIDNLVFISVISQRLPKHKQKMARRLGLAMALITRLLLLACMKWIIGLVDPLFTVFEQTVSGRDLLLLLGGLYLIFEATSAIHKRMEKEETKKSIGKVFYPALWRVVVQIMFLDIIFSLDSVITAVGMAQEFIVMALAICIAIIVMLFASEKLNAIIQKHPSIEVLALCFLLLVGTVLVADGLHFHINRGYIYFAISFAVFVESINIGATRKRKKD